MLLGLIVNPIAGIGGRVGLKGSDGADIRQKALSLGAQPRAGERAHQALKNLQSIKENLQIITYPGEMGGAVAASSGFDVKLIGSIQQGSTSARDTEQAARQMLEMGAGLILFAGGDGTARDICNAVNQDITVLGIPAGVKIQSAVFAKNPASAGEIALKYLNASVQSTRQAEVMDIDEVLYRQGVLSSRLYGYLRVPYMRRHLQGAKTAVPPRESTSLVDIASEVVTGMLDGVLYILGPGTTTRAVADTLALQKTLLGIDVIKDRQLLCSDANESQLLEFLSNQSGVIIITPIGGQGFLLGRGNQQLSPAVIRSVGAQNICIISTPEKIFALQGKPLLVDTGDRDLDESLSGYRQVITGSAQKIIYRVST